MAVSVADVMQQCRNHFVAGYDDGMIAISGNAITPAPESPYVYIKGSWMHDGVWRMVGGYLEPTDPSACQCLPDEEFEGRIYLLNPPRDFIALCEEIAEYDKKNPAGAPMSEKFGNYSVTRNYNTTATTWANVFGSMLAPYRRMFSEVV